MCTISGRRCCRGQITATTSNRAAHSSRSLRRMNLNADREIRRCFSGVTEDKASPTVMWRRVFTSTNTTVLPSTATRSISPNTSRTCRATIWKRRRRRNRAAADSPRSPRRGRRCRRTRVLSRHLSRSRVRSRSSQWLYRRREAAILCETRQQNDSWGIRIPVLGCHAQLVPEWPVAIKSSC